MIVQQTFLQAINYFERLTCCSCQNHSRLFSYEALWVAVIVGFVSGIIYLVTSKMLDRLLINDAVDTIPVHFFNKMWVFNFSESRELSGGCFSTLSCLLFPFLLIKNQYFPSPKVECDCSWITGFSRTSQKIQRLGNAFRFVLYWWYFSALCELIVIAFHLLLVSVIMALFFIFMGYTGSFFSDPLEDVVGLDISYHGVTYCPKSESDFDVVAAIKN